MKPTLERLVFATTLLGGALFFIPTQSHAHGGQYRGPGDTVPRGGAGAGGSGGAGGVSGPGGPSTPNPNGPGTPGAGTPGAPSGIPGRPGSPTGSGDGTDLTEWAFWWEFNKEPYLNLKARVHGAQSATGTDGFFLGHGEQRQARDSYEPSEQQIRARIVPALLAALAQESNNDILTGCLIALAKIGDAPGETSESPFGKVISGFLADRNQEISETAAVALGILANPSAIGTLEALLANSPRGRELVGQPQVSDRTRAFAAYGLGLIGNVAAREEDRRRIVALLHRAIETDSTRTRDLKASCVIAMGLVALETIESPGQPEEQGAPVPPESSRLAQLEYLLAFLANDRQNELVRAHCPTALARLLDGLPPEAHRTYRTRIAEDLLARIERSGEAVVLVQSAVQALGLIGTNDEANPLDRRIRATLSEAPKDASARNFALISLAKIGARTAPDARDAEGGIGEVTRTLLARLADGKSSTKSWAGLACGVMASELSRSGNQSSRIQVLQDAVRTAIDEEGKVPARLGAFAIAAGIMGDVEARPRLMRRLDAERDDTALGYVAVGLGLMGADQAVEGINKVVDASKHRADLLKQASIALGLLGDKEVVPKLTGLLKESKGLATQAALAKALGFIGDKRSIDPLVEMLQNDGLSAAARGFAAAALGIVADKEDLPWNSKIALDLNYLASTSTLTDAFGTGILDIL